MGDDEPFDLNDSESERSTGPPQWTAPVPTAAHDLQCDDSNLSDGGGAEVAPSAPVDDSAASQLVGERVSVHWGGDQTWYAGVIMKMDEQCDSITVAYDDGDTISHILSTAELRLGEPPTPPASGRKVKSQRKPAAERKKSSLSGSKRKPQSCAWRLCPQVEGYTAPYQGDEGVVD